MNSSRLPGSESILRDKLANGTTLLAFENPTSPAVVLRGYLPPGSIADPEGKWGLASLTASMLMTGTRRYNFFNLHDRLESMGASLGVGSGSLMTTFYGQCLREDLPTLLAMLQEVLDQPAFPEDHFNRLKTQTLTGIGIQAQDTIAMADQAFDRNFYGAHPYAHPDIGYAHTVSGLTIEDVRRFHADYYGPSGLVMTVSGGISPEIAAAEFEQTIGTWHKPEQQAQPGLPAYQPIHTTLREHVSLADKSQTDLVIGTLSPKTMSPDYQACALGNSILGQFGMMGRIGEAVRERAGLAYYAQSTLGAGIGPTAWQVMAGVNPANLDKALGLILQELTRFVSEPVSDHELSDARDQAIGRLPLSLETNAGVAQLLLSLERYQLDLDHLRQLPGIFAAITPDDILAGARRYWDLDRLVITSAGTPL